MAKPLAPPRPGNGHVLSPATPHGAWDLLRADPPVAPLDRTVDRWRVAYECLAWQVPRAINARHTPQGRWRAADGDPRALWIGEKLDGVWAAWTGARLLTKEAVELACPAGFRRGLPPFPVVGELYCGLNALEDARGLTQRGGGASAAWAHACLVAFDVPGCAPQGAWPYAARYALLRHVVAAWSARLLAARDPTGAADGLPLQLLRQRPAAAGTTEALFRAVVEGAPWEARVRDDLQGFGIPAVRLARADGAGTRLRLAADHAWVDAARSPYEATVDAAGKNPPKYRVIGSAQQNFCATCELPLPNP